MSSEIVRSEIEEALRKNFLGPIGGASECFSASESETPISRYMTGILFPSESTLPSNDDDGGLGAESKQSLEDDEARLSMCNAPNPSSFGISFSCSLRTKLLVVKIECGIYTLEKNDTTGLPTRWCRREFSSVEKVPVTVSSAIETRALTPGLELRLTFRPPGLETSLPITATLINTHSIKNVSWEEQSTRCFFQCHMTVAVEGDEGGFVERGMRSVANLEPELRHALLLYRHAKLFAVGHGVAADWEPKTGVPRSVSITFIPRYESYPLVPPDDLKVPPLAVLRLATESLQKVSERLDKLVSAYEDWISEVEPHVSNVPSDFKDVAKEQLSSCQDSVRRIRGGIRALSSPIIFRAFQLSQKAMLEVFARSEWQKKRNFDPKSPPTYGDEHTWRPFQMAFILQCLESVANPQSSDRDVCDLLWFPTGGGKTEAYLSITAFTFFLRRLRSAKTPQDNGGRTAVLMRYTLRLLTADQFVRACLLTCASEFLRRNESDLTNTAPITIGLWVGDATSPNKLRDAADALSTLHSGRKLRPDQSSPVKLKRCPWCGTVLSAADFQMAVGNMGVISRCKDSACDFRNGIPAIVVDEQIYQEPPSLLIGTIDKFARVPWVEEAGSIFSVGQRELRPELIIQDELHLISGPLGTVAGLYEAAIDELCTHDGIRPKLIASTATIRNAKKQVRALFNRRLAQFPPPLLDARDSFFARENRNANARVFLGLFTPGKTPLTAFIRMVGTLGHAPFVSNYSDTEKDPYWTQIAYFNSLRELGGAIVRVQDDVAEYLKTCAMLDGSAPAFRSLDEVVELTSRATEDQLDEVRDRLWEMKGSGSPYDIVLCSNMISVGLDVPRLGLMSVVGQPKATAEYIQATSRIGRASPGLVVTLYNWTRSRDRSHYERFVAYHSRLYAEVEATSVTPWSSRARDRALHAVFVAVARHLIPSLSRNASAGSFSPSDSNIQTLIKALKDRISQIEDDPADRIAAHEHLDRIVERWFMLKTALGPNLKYDGDSDRSLLVPFEDYVQTALGFATMNNMRSVDAPAGIYLQT